MAAGEAWSSAGQRSARRKRTNRTPAAVAVARHTWTRKSPAREGLRVTAWMRWPVGCAGLAFGSTASGLLHPEEQTWGAHLLRPAEDPDEELPSQRIP